MTATPDVVAIDFALVKLVRIKSARLAGMYGFNVMDRDDIYQELFLDCLLRLRKFDPAKSSRRGFLHRVVCHRIASLLEAQRAIRRDYRMCRDSLNAPIQFDASESFELGETVSSDDYEARMGRSRLSSRECAEIQIDVATVIATLPAELAGIALVLKSVNAVEAGRRLGLSRATVYRRISDIRQAFAAAGLDGYLRQRQPERRVTAAPGRISPLCKVRARRPHLTPRLAAACPPTALREANCGLAGIIQMPDNEGSRTDELAVDKVPLWMPPETQQLADMPSRHPPAIRFHDGNQPRQGPTTTPNV